MRISVKNSFNYLISNKLIHWIFTMSGKPFLYVFLERHTNIEYLYSNPIIKDVYMEVLKSSQLEQEENDQGHETYLLFYIFNTFGCIYLTSLPC